MAQQNTNIRIGITQGDINGVGIEMIVKALAHKDITELFTPIIFGNAALVKSTAKNLGLEDFEFERVDNLEDIKDGRINLYEVGDEDTAATPGSPSEEGGRAAIEALDRASDAIAGGMIDLLVTAPIDKHTALSKEFPFSGHTEYLDDRFAVEGGKALMILADDKLRVALVTTHLPLAEVPSRITKENVAEKIRAFNMALKMDFGCERPRIAVLALNPHCGDGGLLGREEINEIIPAVEECKKEGILAFGPISADGLFGSGSYFNFDGILAMYHDQGLAPFKALAGGRGVNFTAGLNIIRTSPDHGTAYDKAGRGTADETSMREAIYAAIDIARRRDTYLEASENPLEVRPPVQKNQKRQKDKEETDSKNLQAEE